jgi:hypothetical protein
LRKGEGVAAPRCNHCQEPDIASGVLAGVSRPPEHDRGDSAPTLVDSDAIAHELRRQLANVRARMEAHRETMRAAGLTRCGERARSEDDERKA